MAFSWNWPQLARAIKDDVPAISSMLNATARWNPEYGGGTDLASGMKRLVDVTGGQQLQNFNGTAWATVGKLVHDVDTLDGYHASTTAQKNSIPVYNESALLPGGITGNAETATKLKTARALQVGGIASGDSVDFDGSGPVIISVDRLNLNSEQDDALEGVLSLAHGGTGRTDGAAQDVIINSLSGAVKAKEYGKIGQMPSNYLNDDLNTLIVPGVYQVNTKNGESRHHPMSYPSSFAVVRVEQQSSYITQDYQMYDPMLKFVRKSGDAGATWSGWYSMGGARNGICTIYISKSGSDSNTGLSSENPVLTIERAIRIAEGFSVGKSDAYVRFRIGEGNWGDVTFRSLPFWLQVSPYDGTAPTEYSASLPIFGRIRVYSSSVELAGIVSDIVESCYSSTVYIGVGYKRIGALHAYNYGNIFLASSNSSNNVLEIHQQSISNYLIHAYAGGSIYAHYLTIRLVENITATVFLNINQSRFYAFLGRTLIDLNGFTFTGKKSLIEASGQAYSGESNGARTFFTEVLPGSDAIIYNGAIVNGYTVGQAVDDAVVHRTGNETIGGMKTFSRSIIMENGVHRQWVADTFRPFMYQNADITKGTTPSATTYCYTAWYSSSGMSTSDRIAMNEMAYRNDGSVWNSLVAFKPSTTENYTARITAVYPATGSPYGLAPSTPVGSTGDEILTADFLQKNLTMAGVKTFTSIPVIQSAEPKLFLQYSGIKKGDTPASNTYATLSIFESGEQRYNANVIGNLGTRVLTDGSIESYISARLPEAGSTTEAVIAIRYYKNGNIVASAPTPHGSTNGTAIATTEWVRDRFTISTVAPSGGTNGDFWFQY